MYRRGADRSEKEDDGLEGFLRTDSNARRRGIPEKNAESIARTDLEECLACASRVEVLFPSLSAFFCAFSSRSSIDETG